MSAEDLEKYEAEMELQLYREYRDVVGLFTHVVETERRFYLTNDVELNVRSSDNGEVFFEVTMRDAWVWDMYRPARFVKNALNAPSYDFSCATKPASPGPLAAERNVSAFGSGVWTSCASEM